ESISTYFLRRLRRICPPYWLALLLGFVLFVLVDVYLYPSILSATPFAQLRPWWFSPSQWLGNVSLTETWRHYLFGSPRGHILGQSWTLCYEEQFYAVVGLLLLCSRERFFGGALAVTLVVIGLMLLSATSGVSFEGFFFDGQWLCFASGLLVYYAV